MDLWRRRKISPKDKRLQLSLLRKSFTMNGKWLFLTLLSLTVQVKTYHAGSNDSCQSTVGGRVVICDNKGEIHENPLNGLSKNVLRLKITNYLNLRVPYNFFHKYKLRILTVRTCNISTPFEMPSSINDLDLGSNNLNFTIFSFLASQNLSLLHTLYIPNNSIIVPDTDQAIITGLPFLQKLVFSHNIFRYILKHMFSKIPLLRQLRLSHSKIIHIDSDAFKNLRNLQVLDLSANKLKSVPRDVFRFQSHLQSLSLASNELTFIPRIRGFPSMGLLDFSYNKICEVRNWTIPGLKSILSLILQGNNIKELPREFLRKTQILFTLDLAYNKLTNITEKEFLKRSPSLEVINLSNNQLQSVNKEIFRGLKNIKTLYLNSNNISRIRDATFSGLPISKLFLHDNKLKYLHRPFLGMLSNYPKITLYANGIKALSNTTLQDLRSGANLYVQCNSLKEIQDRNASKVFITCSNTLEMEFKHIDLTAALSLRKNGYECTAFEDSIKHYLNSMTCSTCKPGFYNAGDTYCKSCPRGGYYQDTPGQAKCKKCNNGQYVSHEGGTSARDCMTCPAGTNPYQFAGTRACFCLPGFARRRRFGGCVNCTEEGVTCSNDTLHLAAGYWWKWYDNAYAKKYECFQENLKVMGREYNKECNDFEKPFPKIYKCPLSKACLGGMAAKCHYNYTGPLCAVCSQGYHMTMLGCLSCGSKVTMATQILVVILMFLICILVLCYTSSIKIPKEERFLSDVITSVTKIMLAHYQLLVVIIHLLSNLKWPQIIVRIVSFLYHYIITIFSLPSLKCIHPVLELNAYGQMVLTLSTVITIPVLIFGAMKIHIYISCKDKAFFEIKYERERLIAVYCKALLAIYFVLYPVVCQRILQVLPFNCIRICLDRKREICESYLRVDFSTHCPSSQPSNWKFVYIAYAALAIPIFFPLLLLMLLWKRQHARTGNFAASVTRFCYENYKPQFWYWEVVELLRKLLFAVGFAFFGLNTKTNLGYLIVLSGVCTVLYAYLQPIEHRTEHYLQLYSLSGLFINLCLSVLLWAQPTGDDASGVANSRRSLTIIFFVTNGLPIVFVLIKTVSITAKFCSCQEKKSTENL